MNAQQLATGKAQYDQWAAAKQVSLAADKAQYDKWSAAKQTSLAADKAKYDQWSEANPRVSPKLPVAPFGAPKQNSEMETVRIPQNGGAVIITRPKQKPAADPVAGVPAAAGPTGASPLSYQSGVNVGGGIGRRGVLSGLLSTGNQPNPNVSALARGAAWNDASQIGRGIDAQNQQLQMEQQAKRSELTTSGASNLSKVYGDYAERSNSQVGLAAQIAANNIGFAGGVQSAFNPWSALRGGMR
jgi:hypothetical protein